MNELATHIGRLSGSLLKYLVAAILIFIPLYPKFPSFNVSGTYVAIRAEDFLIGISFIVFCIHIVFAKSKPKLPLMLPVVTFFIVGLVSLYSANFVTHSVSPLISLLHLFRRFEYICVFYLVYFVAHSNLLNRRFLMQLFLLPPLGVFLFGLGQLYLNFPVISTMNEEFSKGVALTMRPGVQLASTFSGHYDLAIYLAMILVVLISWFCVVTNNKARVVTLVSFVLLLWLFVQAGSRIGYFGLTLAALLTPLLHKKPKLSLIFGGLVVASVALSPNLTARIFNLLKVVELKLESSIIRPIYAQEVARPIQQDRSTSIRFDVEWPRAMRAFYKNPFLGTGYSSISLATDNDYLRALGEVGLLGLIAFLSLLVALARGVIMRINSKNKLDAVISRSAVGIIVVMCVSALFLDVFAASKIAIIFWSYLGLAFASAS